AQQQSVRTGDQGVLHISGKAHDARVEDKVLVDVRRLVRVAGERQAARDKGWPIAGAQRQAACERARRIRGGRQAQDAVEVELALCVRNVRRVTVQRGAARRYTHAGEGQAVRRADRAAQVQRRRLNQQVG